MYGAYILYTRRFMTKSRRLGIPPLYQRRLISTHCPNISRHDLLYHLHEKFMKSMFKSPCSLLPNPLH